MHTKPIYQLICNGAMCAPQTAAWQGETANGRMRAVARHRLQPKVFAHTALVGATFGAWVGLATASGLPQGGGIVAGQGVINQSGATMTVTQTSGKLVADWQSFNIAQGNIVNFVQPSSSAAVLNRVLGADISVIQGSLTSNGQVFLVNPNGVLFTPSAQVNVGGLVASTLLINKEDFLAGRYQFQGAGGGSIVNQGELSASDGGTVALIAARIINQGSVKAPSGNVLMGAGSRVLLDLGGVVKLSVQQGAIDALVEQGGAIRADGGLVYLTAKAVGDLTSTVINHTGVTEARTLATGEKGRILLIGGLERDRISVAGTLDASAPNGGDGGFIETSAAAVRITDDLRATTRAPRGTIGQWLIDPTDFIVAASGGDMTGASLSNLLADSSVEISSISGSSGTGGDVFIKDPITWNSGTTLTLSAQRDIRISADITAQHAYGKLSLWYGLGAPAVGNPASYYLANGAKVNLQAGQNFYTKVGSDGALQGWKVITALGSQGSATSTDLQGMQGGLSTRYVLGADIDAAATTAWNGGQGFMPVGSQAAAFIGSFDGLGHVISNLTINRAGTNVGLFGYVNSASTTLGNVGLVNASITLNPAGQMVATGVLAGWVLDGSVRDAYSTGSVSGGNYVGGLVGWLGTGARSTVGTVVRTYSEATVRGARDLGGLVGLNFNHAISQSFATGAVTGSGNYVGGLVGRIYYTSITDAYATGAVTAAPSSVAYGTGGLVGLSFYTTLARTYAAGGTLQGNQPGGLVGQIVGGSVSSSFWDMQSSGVETSGGGAGVVGKSTADMRTLATYAGWSMSSAGGDHTTWRMYEGSATPLLRSFLTPIALSGAPRSVPVVKVYDGTATRATIVPGIVWTRDGVPFAPDASLLLGDTIRLASKDVGLYNASFDGNYSRHTGYDIAVNVADPAMVQIQPRPLSISGSYALPKIADGSTFALVVPGVLSGLLGSETLGVSASGVFDSPIAGVRRVTAHYTLTDGANGGLAGNYFLPGGQILSGIITPSMQPPVTPPVASPVVPSSPSLISAPATSPRAAGAASPGIDGAMTDVSVLADIPLGLGTGVRMAQNVVSGTDAYPTGMNPGLGATASATDYAFSGVAINLPLSGQLTAMPVGANVLLATSDVPSNVNVEQPSASGTKPGD